MTRPSPVHRAPSLANGFELVRLLELVGETCTRAGPWQGHVLLLTVESAEPMLLGADLGRMWRQRAGESLRGLSASELLATCYAPAPSVTLDGPIWRFESRSPAPLAARFTQVTRPDELARVRRGLSEAAADLDRFKAAHRAVVARSTDAPGWQTCPLCSPLVEAGFGAQLPSAEYTELPVRHWYMPVLGAPTFRDDVDRGWCVKRCPACRTYYLWEADYEYLVNGATEDSSSFTRLTDDQAAPWLARVEATVRAAAAAGAGPLAP